MIYKKKCKICKRKIMYWCFKENYSNFTESEIKEAWNNDTFLICFDCELILEHLQKISETQTIQKAFKISECVKAFKENTANLFQVNQLKFCIEMDLIHETPELKELIEKFEVNKDE